MNPESLVHTHTQADMTAEKLPKTKNHVKPVVYETLTSKSMHFSARIVESRMHKERPWELQFEYNKIMMGFLLYNPSPASIAMIGLGGGSLAKFCYRYLAQTHITVIEINPHVIALRDAFALPLDNERFSIVQGDGADFVRETKQKFDILLADGFDIDGLPEELSTPLFYDNCRDVLNPGGVFVTNLPGSNQFLDLFLNRIQTSFKGSLLTVQDPSSPSRLAFAIKDVPNALWSLTGTRCPQGFGELAWKELEPSLKRVFLATRELARAQMSCHAFPCAICMDIGMTETKFNELMYLNLHQDVRLAVERGDFKSGWDHYEKYGKFEGRRDSRFEHNSHLIRDYSRLVRMLVAEHPDNLGLAMAKAVGAQTLDIFREMGEKQFQVLRRFGLEDGYAIYDLACGSGSTAAALLRHGWSGDYRGADIIAELANYAEQTNPGLRFFVHSDYSINASDNTLDIVFTWSLFTHLQLEEIFLYAKDCLRALKPGGILLFGFLTLKDRLHRDLILNRATALENGVASVHLDTFLDTDTISILFERMLGFSPLGFIDAGDENKLGQALAAFRK